jgi:hypothetical protein
MAQTDVRQDGADYNRLWREWKESFHPASAYSQGGRFDATSP